MISGVSLKGSLKVFRVGKKKGGGGLVVRMGSLHRVQGKGLHRLQVGSLHILWCKLAQGLGTIRHYKVQVQSDIMGFREEVHTRFRQEVYIKFGQEVYTGLRQEMCLSTGWKSSVMSVMSHVKLRCQGAQSLLCLPARGHHFTITFTIFCSASKKHRRHTTRHSTFKACSSVKNSICRR